MIRHLYSYSIRPNAGENLTRCSDACLGGGGRCGGVRGLGGGGVGVTLPGATPAPFTRSLATRLMGVSRATVP